LVEAGEDKAATRRGFASGVAVGLITGCSTNLFQYWLQRRDSDRHEFGLQFYAYDFVEHKYWAIVENAGNVSERNMIVTFQLFADPPITVTLPDFNTTPSSLGSQLSFEVDEDPSDKWATASLSFPRLNPGDKVGVAVHATTQFDWWSMHAQSDDWSALLDASGTNKR
jgi:hypothetical protein